MADRTEPPKETSKMPVLSAGARPTAIVPATFEDAYRMARVFANTQLVPKEYQGKPEAACVAILQGLELGLSPMAAMQSIAVVNGKPCLYGDGMLAVVRASGLMEWMKETDDGTTATCAVKRKGEVDPIVRTFSDDDAKRAGLFGKPGPWSQYRPRMRQMRARSYALRDTFADVLRGISSADEMQDVVDITPKPAVLDVPDIPDATDPSINQDVLPLEVNQDAPASAPFANPKAYVAHLGEEMAVAQSLDILGEIWVSHLEVSDGRLSREHAEEAETLFEKNEKRLKKASK